MYQEERASVDSFIGHFRKWALGKYQIEYHS